MILTDISSRNKLAQDYDFQVGLENMTVNDLDDLYSLKMRLEKYVRLTKYYVEIKG